MGRYKLGVMAMGGAKEAIDVSVKYANERIQFKQAIANFGAIKFKIAPASYFNLCYRICRIQNC